ncbi:MAG: redoxin domain-containing protein [Nanoarchaeota archaeon]
MNKKPLFLLISIVIIASLIYYFESSKITSANITNTETVEVNTNEQLSQEQLRRIQEKEKLYQKAPELVGISGYLNADEIKISDLKNKIVLVDFWTYTCINCIRTLPYLTEWDEKYRDKGLVIIGVHTPEFEFEKNYDNVKAAIEKYNIKYPVVQDNDYATWQAYKNRYWPHKYLIDNDGFIRYDHIGEGAYEETEKKIQELLSELGQDISDMETSKLEDKTPAKTLTPELYAGYSFALPRGQNIGNNGGLLKDEIVDYKLPENIKQDKIYLEGKWKSNPDNLQAQDEEKSSIILNFLASSVNIVSNKPTESLKLEVFIDNEYVKQGMAGQDVQFENGKVFVLINEARLYNIFNGEYGRYTLRVSTDSQDFSFNAFTFG